MQTGSFHVPVVLLVAGLRCSCHNGLGKDPDPSERLMDIGESPISAQNERRRCVECAVAGAVRSRVVLPQVALLCLVSPFVSQFSRV